MARTASEGTNDHPPSSSSVASIVRAELARRRISARDLVPLRPWSERTLRRRLADQIPFTVDELTDIARHLGVPPSTFLPERDAA
jgi:hypothetical protein